VPRGRRHGDEVRPAGADDRRHEVLERHIHQRLVLHHPIDGSLIHRVDLDSFRDAASGPDRRRDLLKPRLRSTGKKHARPRRANACATALPIAPAPP
jgi:hypothetical protein